MGEHDVLGMPVHDGIPQVETLHVRHSRCFHFFRKLEKVDQSRDFGYVELDQQNLLIGVEEG